MKTTKSGAKASATDTSDREHNPLIDAARAIGAAVGKVSNSLGISSPPQTKAQPASKATDTRKGGSRRKAKSGKTAKPAVSKKR